MTAVEWLKRQYIERGETLPSGVFQEALEMEKDQIIEAFDFDGYREGEPWITNGHQYYQDVVKTKNNE